MYTLPGGGVVAAVGAAVVVAVAAAGPASPTHVYAPASTRMLKAGLQTTAQIPSV